MRASRLIKASRCTCLIGDRYRASPRSWAARSSALSRSPLISSKQLRAAHSFLYTNLVTSHYSWATVLSATISIAPRWARISSRASVWRRTRSISSYYWVGPQGLAKAHTLRCYQLGWGSRRSSRLTRSDTFYGTSFNRRKNQSCS